ncbi:MAG: adenylosuccinate lyase [Nannocystaceae bacterium]
MSEPSTTAVYASPLATRYATRAMLANFGDRRRALLWRDLWIALAEAQHELGLPVSLAQIKALSTARENIDFARVATLERDLRHDVMAHVHHYGEVAGEDASKVIHLGATSCFVTDNAELVMMRAGLDLLIDRLCVVLRQLRRFAVEHRELATLAYTHYQPAQLTTVGKRACLWAQDLAFDLESVATLRERLWFRGVKGTTGTQASFLSLFEGDHEKIRLLDQKVCNAMGFATSIPVSGQTYTRKIDTWVLSCLADIAGSAAKLSNDIRLLSHEREVEEPYEDKQIGSSAMAYKRNPMRSERVVSLARFVHSLATSPRETHANQWLERTLDDSANRRLVITEGFLATDAILNLLVNVTSALVVNPAMTKANMTSELAFMATENVMMEGVKAGSNRQALHERVRVLSRAAAERMKREAAPNDLMERMKADPDLGPHVRPEAMDPRQYVGRAPEQVDEFVRGYLDPLLERHGGQCRAFTPDVRV